MARNVVTNRANHPFLAMKKQILTAAMLSLPFPLSAQLVINELLYDPSPGNDVNQDGNANTSEDEFVEIVNTGASTVDLTGYQLVDASGNTFTFPPFSLDPNQALVVFGGGSPASLINGAPAFVGAPSLNNGGDTITLLDNGGLQIDQVIYADNSSDDESLNRSPELTGSFIPHTTIAGSVGTESPGTDVAGNSFGNPLPALLVSPSESSIDESGPGNTVILTVTLPEAPESYPVTVSLSSNDLTEATVPASIMIDSGLTGSFEVTGVDDPDPDGDREVGIVISAAGFRGTTATITVRDDGDTGTDAGSPLLFTQYYEGSSNRKYLELTNVSDSDLDLSGFILTRWTNAGTEGWKVDGNFPSSELALVGVLPPGASYVIANPSAQAPPLDAGQGDITSDITFFNGDDSIVLYQGSVGVANIVDALSFTDDGNEGGEKSFIRQNTLVGFSLDAGSTILDFPVVWLDVPLGTVDTAALGDDEFLGSSSLGTISPLVSLTSTSATLREDGGAIEIEVEILNPDGASVTVSLEFDEANSTASRADIANFTTQTVTFPAGAQSGDTATFTVNLSDDAEAEPAEVARFQLTNLATAGGARIGGGNGFSLSIQDNDTVIPPVYLSEIADPGDTFSARFVELFNPTSEAIDLTAGNWNLVYYVNGATTGRDIPLFGTIPAGGTFVLATNSADYAAAYPEAPAANQENGDVNSNGNDTIELRFGGGQASGAVVDVYGVPGVDGVGEPWQFLDSRVTRIVEAPNPTFTLEEWTIAPANVADMTPGLHGEGGVNPGQDFRILSFSLNLTEGSGVINATGLGTKVWTVETSADLGATDPWAEVAGGVSEQDQADGSTNFLFFFVPGNGETERFYRLVEVP